MTGLGRDPLAGPTTARPPSAAEEAMERATAEALALVNGSAGAARPSGSGSPATASGPRTAVSGSAPVTPVPGEAPSRVQDQMQGRDQGQSGQGSRPDRSGRRAVPDPASAVSRSCSEAGTAGGAEQQDRVGETSGPAAPATPSGSATSTESARLAGSAGPAGHGRDRHGATPWPEARRIARQAAHGPLGAVLRGLDEALGHVLAMPVEALTDLPSFDSSAMDGWAVAGPGPWQLTQVGDGGLGILAGQDELVPLADGQAVPIATGARVPPGATGVLRSEYGEIRSRAARPAGGAPGDSSANGTAGPADSPATRPGAQPAARPDAWLHITTSRGPGVTPGQDIRPRGQECRSGDELLPAGELVTPAVLGLLAAAGYDELRTIPRPRAEVLVLGDELLLGGLPREGRIRDALGPMLGPWLRVLGADVIATRRLGDDAELLHEVLTTSSADLIVTTGGTASGPVDHVHPTLRRIGAELLVDGVAVRPGHPMLLARLRPGRYLVGLPGNPLAAVTGLLTLAQPLLRTLAGRGRYAAETTAPLTEAVSGHPRDTRLVPVRYHVQRAVPLHFTGPAMLRGLAVADGLAIVPPGGAAAGAEVEVLEFPWRSGNTT